MDEGRQLRVDVTASGEGGQAIASSELTDGVKPGPLPPPENTGLPLISGEARDTETLTGTDGYWAGASSARAYQWLRCASANGANCSPIPGAERNSYTLTRADVGSTIRLRVTATNASGPSAADSSPTAIVQPLALRVKLSVYLSKPCTGIPVVLDASASQTPNPPLHYKFRDWGYFPYWYGDLATNTNPLNYDNDPYQPGNVLSDGASPRTSVTFNWDRHVTGIGAEDEEPAGQWAFDRVVVIVDVTDAAGATASAGAWLDPAQRYSGAPRSQCPKRRDSQGRPVCAHKAGSDNSLEHELDFQSSLHDRHTLRGSDLGCTAASSVRRLGHIRQDQAQAACYREQPVILDPRASHRHVERQADEGGPDAAQTRQVGQGHSATDKRQPPGPG